MNPGGSVRNTYQYTLKVWVFLFFVIIKLLRLFDFVPCLFPYLYTLGIQQVSVLLLWVKTHENVFPINTNRKIRFKHNQTRLQEG